jgi:hypothetical protein
MALGRDLELDLYLRIDERCQVAHDFRRDLVGITGYAPRVERPHAEESPDRVFGRWRLGPWPDPALAPVSARDHGAASASLLQTGAARPRAGSVPTQGQRAPSGGCRPARADSEAARHAPPAARRCADSSPAAPRSPAARPHRPPTSAPVPTPTRSAPPHLSLDVTDQSSLKGEADAISDAASGALFDCRSRCSIELRASWAEAWLPRHLRGTRTILIRTGVDCRTSVAHFLTCRIFRLLNG